MNVASRITVALAMACSAPIALAQAPQEIRKVPPQGSAWERYRPFTPDEALIDWRAANETVHAAGGHMGLMGSGARGHGSHGASPAPAPVKPAAQPAKPAPGEHAGHAGHATPKEKR